MRLVSRLEFESKLGCDDDLIAHRSESFADEFFIYEGTVDLSGIEEGYAAVDGAAHDRDHFLLCTRDGAVTGAHPHTTQADGRDFKIAFSKSALLHLYLLACVSKLIFHAGDCFRNIDGVYGFGRRST
jgi:hypothetical protein